MDWLLIVAGALLGYLLGSVPVGVLATAIYGVDIRTIGSGRTGATNAWRAAGLKAAIPTLLGDALKGVAAVLLMRYVAGAFFPDMDAIAVAAAAALAGAVRWSVTTGRSTSASKAAPAALRPRPRSWRSHRSLARSFAWSGFC